MRTAEERAEQTDLEAVGGRLPQGQRVEAMGRLAAILAHDIKNYLTAIGWSADDLARRLPTDGPEAADLEAIGEAVREGSAVVESVLAFARPAVAGSATDLAAHVRSLAVTLERFLGHEVVLVLDLAPGLAPVALDAASLTQVLLNLVTNAAEAMGQRGTVRISVRELAVGTDGEAGGDADDEGQGPDGRLPAGRYVRMTFGDDGPGMDEETARRAFEPFFTTKDRVAGIEGTGLGLASVDLVVGRAGGRVRLRTAPGAGATFILDLPVAGG